MGLLSTEVEIGLSGGNITYFENLGYKIPRTIDKYGDLRVPIGTQIKVDIKDVNPKSHIMVKVQCDKCKNVFNVSYCLYYKENTDGQFYCKHCKKELKSSNKKIRYTNKRNIKGYPEFIQSVLTRDNYTCYCCGATGNIVLNVHHLNGFHWDKAGRMDLKNAITLCEICHNNFHVKYGNKNNTKEQFESWIGTQLSLKENFTMPTKEGRKIYCIEDNIIYQNVDEAKEKLNLKNSSPIYNVCNHNPLIDKGDKLKSHYTVRGKHLMWYEDFLKFSKCDIERYIKSTCFHASSKKKIICITTNKIFESIQEGIDYYKCNNHVRDCCNGKRNYCGHLPDGTRLQWMYYDDYLNNINQNLKEVS